MGVLPQGRGTPSDIHHRIQCVRFILADAGNSWLFGVLKRTKTVYPRWRGELAVDFAGVVSAGGLSPLARGTLIMTHGRPDKVRFIPAGAGNSPVASFPVVSSSVYPRWRGELYINEVNLWKLYGLSPLARGTLFMRGSKSPRRRFIPAGAGNSGESGCVHQWSSVYPRWRGELKQIVRFPHIHDGLSPLARGTPLFHPLML